MDLAVKDSVHDHESVDQICTEKVSEAFHAPRLEGGDGKADRVVISRCGAADKPADGVIDEQIVKKRPVLHQDSDNLVFVSQVSPAAFFLEHVSVLKGYAPYAFFCLKGDRRMVAEGSGDSGLTHSRYGSKFARGNHVWSFLRRQRDPAQEQSACRRRYFIPESALPQAFYALIMRKNALVSAQKCALIKTAKTVWPAVTA